MTAVLLVSLYFVALTAFLGLDILSKVPATMYALALAALGTLSAVGVVGALYVTVRATSSTGSSLGIAAAGLGAAAAGAGLASIGRLLRAFAPRKVPRS
ncbi:MAG TPA: proton-translocating transhydrogenase family protein [Polyangia bacterium]|nr:proton-translocating transhydrogenase family protein [Polyangia bacterium]